MAPEATVRRSRSGDVRHDVVPSASPRCRGRDHGLDVDARGCERPQPVGREDRQRTIGRFERVPAVCFADPPRRNKARRRKSVAPQDRHGLVEHARVSVVERDGDRGSTLPGAPGDEVGERHDPTVPREVIHMANELRDRHEQVVMDPARAAVAQPWYTMTVPGLLMQLPSPSAGSSRAGCRVTSGRSRSSRSSRSPSRSRGPKRRG